MAWPVCSCNTFRRSQHRAVSHFLRQRMLEQVLHFRKRGLFVEKLFALERGEQAVECLFGLGDHLAHQAQRELPPNDGELLEKAFSSGARRSMRAARTPCTVEGICRASGADGAVTADRPYLGPDQHALFH